MTHSDLRWQKECYEFYRTMGVARFSANYIGTALSRATISVTGKREISQHALNQLFGARKAENLKMIGIHTTIAGEYYVVGRAPVDWEVEQDPGLEGVQEIWEILSVQEISRLGNGWQIDYGHGDPAIVLTETDAVIRIWTPDPERKKFASSPFQALLPTMREIKKATDRIAAMYASRLTGNGLLMLPQGIDLPTVPGQSKTDSKADGVVRLLVEMAKATGDDPSPESQLPGVLLIPDELVGKSEHLTFFSDFDAETVNNRDRAYRLFALGMELPPEKILGVSGQADGQERGSNHWNVWAVDEDTIKMHVEPILDVTLSILSSHFLRVITEDPTDEFTYDLKNLHLRPDRSKEAVILYNLGLLTPERMLEENGFDPKTDLPTGEQYKAWLVRKVAVGSATPEQMQAAWEHIGLQLDVKGQIISNADEVPEQSEPRETPQPPSLEDVNQRPAEPEQHERADAASLLAAEGLVLRALERAGNKVLRKEGGRQGPPAGIDPVDAHCHYHVNGEGPALLDGGFRYADRVLGAEVDETVEHLKGYCLALFAEEKEHSRENLANYLEVCRG